MNFILKVLHEASLSSNVSKRCKQTKKSIFNFTNFITYDTRRIPAGSSRLSLVEFLDCKTAIFLLNILEGVANRRKGEFFTLQGSLHAVRSRLFVTRRTQFPIDGYSRFQVTGMIEWGQKSKPPQNNKTKKYPWTSKQVKNKFGCTLFAELHGRDT